MREEQSITDWDKLAETGWQEMRTMLQQHTPAVDTPLITGLGKRNYFILIAVCLTIILVNVFPAYLNDSLIIPFRQVSKDLAILKPISPIHPALINSVSHKKEITALYNHKSNAYPFATNAAALSIQETIPPFSLLNIVRETSLNATSNIHPITADRISQASKYSSVSRLVKKQSFLKRLQIFGGAGFNLPGLTSNPGSISWSEINIHPSVTVIIPLNSKFSLHTGIHAMSTLHQKGVAIKNEERVSILGSNYTTNTTTSIIKVSYFDLPLALHYSINHHWTIGGGLQLSKFYKLNIREEKKSYDFNNRLISATAQQYFVNAGQIGVPPLQDIVNIKRFDARLIAETSLRTSRWLITAGYYYGTQKNIELKETSGQSHLFRNEYFRIGVEYQLYKK